MKEMSPPWDENEFPEDDPDGDEDEHRKYFPYETDKGEYPYSGFDNLRTAIGAECRRRMAEGRDDDLYFCIAEWLMEHKRTTVTHAVEDLVAWYFNPAGAIAEMTEARKREQEILRPITDGHPEFSPGQAFQELNRQTDETIRGLEKRYRRRNRDEP